MSDEKKDVPAELQAMIDQMPEPLRKLMTSMAQGMQADNGKEYKLILSVSFGDAEALTPEKTIHMISDGVNIGRAELRLNTIMNMAKGMGFQHIDTKVYDKPEQKPSDAPLH